MNEKYSFADSIGFINPSLVSIRNFIVVGKTSVYPKYIPKAKRIKDKGIITNIKSLLIFFVSIGPVAFIIKKIITGEASTSPLRKKPLSLPLILLQES